MHGPISGSLWDWGLLWGQRGVQTQSHLLPQGTALWGDFYGVWGLLWGWRGLQTHTEPTPPSLTFRPKVRPYKWIPMGSGGRYGAGGVCRPSITFQPKVLPYGETPMGLGVVMGPEGLWTQPHLLPQGTAL